MITRRDFIKYSSIAIAFYPVKSYAEKLEKIINSYEFKKPLIIYNIELPVNKPQIVRIGHGYPINYELVLTAGHILRENTLTIAYNPFSGNISKIKPVYEKKDVLITKKQKPYIIAETGISKQPPKEQEYVYSINYENTDFIARELCNEVISCLEFTNKDDFIQKKHIFKTSEQLGVSRNIGKAIKTHEKHIYAFKMQTKKSYSGSPVFNLENKIQGIITESGKAKTQNQEFPVAIFVGSEIINELIKKIYL